MKKIFLALTVLALALTACDKESKNPFEGTEWTNTTYIAGAEAWISFEDLTCRIGITWSPDIVEGHNYTYTHSDKKATLTPIGENTASHEAVLSGNTLTVTTLSGGTVIVYTKK